MCFFFLLLLTPTPPPLSQDDAINSNNIQYFERLYDRTNPNGCPATGTFFVSHKYSNYRMVQEVYKRGHEIASHTISHSHRGDWTEIEEMRQILFQLAGIPANEVRPGRVQLPLSSSRAATTP